MEMILCMTVNAKKPLTTEVNEGIIKLAKNEFTVKVK